MGTAWKGGKTLLVFMRKDESNAMGAGSAGAGLGAQGEAKRGWGQHLHDVIELQPRVRGGIDEDVGQRVLVVVHLICETRGKGW